MEAGRLRLREGAPGEQQSRARTQYAGQPGLLLSTALSSGPGGKICSPSTQESLVSGQPVWLGEKRGKTLKLQKWPTQQTRK